jgi:predicted ArsR family transcriptional regulator
MVRDENIKSLYKELKIITDENRLGILTFLKKKKSASVGEISDQLKISFKATSKHLLFLVENGVLIRKPDNPFVIYSLSDNPDMPKSIKYLISLL